MKILVFGIHPDDVELGCGATVVLATEQGHEVSIVDLTDGSASSNGTPAIRAKEAEKAAAIMGVRRRLNLEFPDTGVLSEDLGQVKAVVQVIRDVEPALVLAPSSNDPHPDHEHGGKLIARALYLSGIHGYEKSKIAWRPKQVLVYPGRVDVEAQVVVDVTNTFARKLDAVRAHASQFESNAESKPTPLNGPDFLGLVESRARNNGALIGVRFGEAFETRAPLGLVDLALLDG